MCEFQDIVELDHNLISNVVDMQNEFANERGFAYPEDNHVISVFEVLAVMAIKAEDELMTNGDYGDRTPVWFYAMLHNLELDAYPDYIWNRRNENEIKREIEDIMVRFLNREYNYDGSDGGAFVLRHPREDLRGVDLWYQLLWWLSENYQDEF